MLQLKVRARNAMSHTDSGITGRLDRTDYVLVRRVGSVSSSTGPGAWGIDVVQCGKIHLEVCEHPDKNGDCPLAPCPYKQWAGVDREGVRVFIHCKGKRCKLGVTFDDHYA